MALPAAAVFVKAAYGECGEVLGVGALVELAHLLLDAVEPDARDARRHAREELGDERARESEGLEIIAPAVGADHRDAHLGHDLEQPLVGRGLVAAQHLLEGKRPEETAPVAVGKRLLCQVGIDRGGTHADEDAEIMHVQALGAAHVERAEGAQLLAHEMGVHGSRRENHGNGRALGAIALVGEHEMLGAAAHRVLGFLPDTGDRLAQDAVALLGIEGAIDVGCRRAHVGAHPLELAVRENGRAELEQAALQLVLVQNVAEIAEPRHQRHDPRLAQGVDRRVGHLAEILPEVMMQAAVLLGKHGERGVVAHGADRLLGVLRHRVEHDLKILERPADRDLAAAELLAFELDALARTLLDQAVELLDLLDPLAVGPALGQHLLGLAVVVELARPQVDRDHLAGADAALLDDARLVEAHHAGLRAYDEQSVAGQGVAHGAQAVAIHEGDRPLPAIGADRRRAVPRLHDGVAVGVELLDLLRQARVVRPGLGHQDGLDHGHAAVRTHHDLEHRIERHGIRAARLDDRQQVRHVAAEPFVRHARLVGLHPIDVAEQRIDLAVVGEHAEGLRQPPGGKRVGRIALVVDGEIRDEALVEQVGVEGGELLGQEHPLVDDRAAGERADIEVPDALGEHLLLDAPADDEEIDLELPGTRPLGVVDQDLLDLGTGRVRLLADHGDVDRHLTPAVDAVAHGEDLGLDDAAAALLCCEIGARQEDHADGEPALARLVALVADVLLEEVLGDLHVDAGTVARLAVGIHGTAMPQHLECRDSRGHHLAARLAVDRGDKADAAGIVLLGRVVEAVARQRLGVLAVLRDEALAALAHALVGRHAGPPLRQSDAAGAEALASSMVTARPTRAVMGT